MFEYLARNDPTALIVLANSLQPAHLTHAAEWIGRSGDPRAGQVLATLLRHPSPLVREGAIVGLEALGGPALEGCRALLIERALEGSEPSPGVRAAARDALSLLALG
jgi:HEAT repeat protein